MGFYICMRQVNADAPGINRFTKTIDGHCCQNQQEGRQDKHEIQPKF